MDIPRRSDCTAGQMDGEAGWWITSGNIGLPPLARVMGVGRQQQHRRWLLNLNFKIVKQQIQEILYLKAYDQIRKKEGDASLNIRIKFI